MGCCQSSSEVAVSAEKRKEQKLEQKALMDGLDSLSKGGGVDLKSLTGLLEKSPILVSRLGGPGVTAEILARSMMEQYDYDKSGTLSGFETAQLKGAFTTVITHAFSIFLINQNVSPGGIVQGILMLTLESPLIAECIQVSIAGTEHVSFQRPETEHYRDSNGNNQTRTHYHTHAETRQFLSAAQILYAPPDRIFQPGIHRFHFAFALPPVLPQSLAVRGTGLCPQGNGAHSSGEASITYSVVGHTIRSSIDSKAIQNAKKFQKGDVNAKTSSVVVFTVLPPPVFMSTLQQPAAWGVGPSLIRKQSGCCCPTYEDNVQVSVNQQTPGHGLVDPGLLIRTHSLPPAMLTSPLQVFLPNEPYVVKLGVTNNGTEPVESITASLTAELGVALRVGFFTWTAEVPVVSGKNKIDLIAPGETKEFDVQIGTPPSVLACANTGDIQVWPVMKYQTKMRTGKTCDSFLNSPFVCQWILIAGQLIDDRARVEVVGPPIFVPPPLPSGPPPLYFVEEKEAKREKEGAGAYVVPINPASVGSSYVESTPSAPPPEYVAPPPYSSYDYPPSAPIMAATATTGYKQATAPPPPSGAHERTPLLDREY